MTIPKLIIQLLITLTNSLVKIFYTCLSSCGVL